jgi:predicted dehydrogenase
VTDSPLRIGVLGAARIAPAALVRPARSVPSAEVVSVAARDPERAKAFASKHGVPRTHDSYDALVDDPDIDAIYNPLPNGLHARWTVRALESGKHVLCEKPFTNNADEAAHVAATADRTGRVVMEAFHYRYHPLAERMLEIVSGGELGTIERVEAWTCFPLPLFSDIRYQYDLGGGAQMDAGCYAVHMARLLGREEPEVISAQAKLHSADIDRAMRAELRYPSGHTGTVTCSMWSRSLLHMSVRVSGSDGTLNVLNPTAPQLYHRLSVKSAGGSRVEHLSRRPTYTYQLEAFCAAVLKGEPTLTPPPDSIANMRVIDAIYTAAGMRLRGS